MKRPDPYAPIVHKTTLTVALLLLGQASAAPLIGSTFSFAESSFCKKHSCNHISTYTATNYEDKVIVPAGGKVFFYNIATKGGVYYIWVARNKNTAVTEVWAELERTFDAKAAMLPAIELIKYSTGVSTQVATAAAQHWYTNRFNSSLQPPKKISPSFAVNVIDGYLFIIKR